MNYIITLEQGIGNVIQAMLFCNWLRRCGHKVYIRHRADFDVWQLIQDYDGKAEDISNAIDKGGLFNAEGKRLMLEYGEWRAWFVMHGIEPPGTSRLAVSLNYASPEFSGVVLAPCSKPNWPMKKWPYWQVLIDRLPGCTVVGAKGDGGELTGQFNDMRSENSLPETVGVLKRARYVIAEEGGIAHVAAALKNQTYILTGGTGIRKNKSFSDTARYISAHAGNCQPCQPEDYANKGVHFGCRPEYLQNGYSECMVKLKPERVINTIQEVKMKSEYKTLIIPAYKATETLERMLDSVQAQTVRPDKVLIGADGDRETAVEAQRLQAKYKQRPGVKKADTLNIDVYYFPRNVGPFRVRNTLALLASPGIILTFDSDDVMYSEYIETMTKSLDKSRFSVATSRQYKPDGKLYNEAGKAFGCVGIYRDSWIQYGGWEPWRASADAEAAYRWQANGLQMIMPKKAIMDQLKRYNSVSIGTETGYGSELRKAYSAEVGTRRANPVRCDSIGIADFVHVPANADIEDIDAQECIFPVNDDYIMATLGQAEKTGDDEARAMLYEMVSVLRPKMNSRERDLFKRAKNVLGIPN